MTALFASMDGGVSALQRAGSIAAIVGASVAVLLLLAGIFRWWWRHHRVWSVKPRVFVSGDTRYLGVTGLPASTSTVTAFVSDGTENKRFGPDLYRRSIQPEHLINLRLGQPLLSESVKKYKVEIVTTSAQGGSRRVFKKKVRTPR
jgi:hypothetical protein